MGTSRTSQTAHTIKTIPLQIAIALIATTTYAHNYYPPKVNVITRISRLHAPEAKPVQETPQEKQFIKEYNETLAKIQISERISQEQLFREFRFSSNLPQHLPQKAPQERQEIRNGQEATAVQTQTKTYTGYIKHQLIVDKYGRVQIHE